MDKHTIDEIVRKAYNRYYEVRKPHIDELALSTLNEYHDKINNWQGNIEEIEGINFYTDFLLGEHMEAISSSGAAAIKHDIFRKIMRQKGTAKKMAILFCLRRDHELNPDLASKITEVRFINHVLNNRERTGNKPRIYTNRIIVSIFIEIMTSIADRKRLEQTASKLGLMNPDEIPFAELQIKVRQIVDHSLLRQDLGNELSKFSRATIAYHIKDI